MPDDIALACRCGQVRATLRGVSPRTGNHGICYCVDCRAFARHLGQENDVLDLHGGTDIYQTQPHRMTIEAGAEALAVLRLSPKGLYRWYASCCDTPICNTLASPKISFVGVVVATMKPPLDALGPVTFHHKPEQATPPITEPSGSVLWPALRTMRRAVRSLLDGRWRETPFFDPKTGRSIAAPHVLTEAERERAYDARESAVR